MNLLELLLKRAFQDRIELLRDDLQNAAEEDKERIRGRINELQFWAENLFGTDFAQSL